ncbi:MAG TPA: histidine kinase [Methylibium sp.]|uniref:hybrid sensor histidine kinase/response regulator n=1 Tax=Methylibium sp. TaxID=2067992 RepID=UPI002DB9EEA0|nr:histidine kinase [Methylibium sp.]HEU4458597.1 histidine kinase [Methylibium sp.]
MPLTAPAHAVHLRVLHLEDSELDHELMLAHLRAGGLEVDSRRVESEGGFRQALAEPWDVIVSDYNLPGFSGLKALEILRDQHSLLVPFILVSGEIGEQVAVQAMLNGANDYLLKDKLARLVPAVLHAIEGSEALRAKHEADLALGQSEQRLRELAQHLQASVEAERTAIAREIHDDVGGSLTALKFDLAWIERHCGNAAVAQRAQNAIETVMLAIESSQRIMHNLRPAILEQGLLAALQWMTQRFEKRSNVVTLLRTSHDTLPTLPAGVPLAAYRTAQEALTNISKHANATRVEVDLTIARGVLSLEVSDNGRGLSQDDLGKARSFGIRGLRERAAQVGGWVDLSSGPGGTTIILSVPLGTERSKSGRATQPDTGHHDSDDPTSWDML